MKAVVLAAFVAVSAPSYGFEVAVTENGTQVVYWCARTVIVDDRGYSDVKRTCGWWNPRTGELIKRGR